MNKVLLCGNLTRDVELTSTTSGISVARFTLAVQRNFANQDGEREADFINIVVWRNQAENCAKYLSKGSKVIVDGRLQVRPYEDNDGNKRYATEVIADSVEFVSTKKDGGEANDNPPPPPADNRSDLTPVENDDGLPF